MGRWKPKNSGLFFRVRPSPDHIEIAEARMARAAEPIEPDLSVAWKVYCTKLLEQQERAASPTKGYRLIVHAQGRRQILSIERRTPAPGRCIVGVLRGLPVALQGSLSAWQLGIDFAFGLNMVDPQLHKAYADWAVEQTDTSLSSPEVLLAAGHDRIRRSETCTWYLDWRRSRLELPLTGQVVDFIRIPGKGIPADADAYGKPSRQEARKLATDMLHGFLDGLYLQADAGLDRVHRW